jgi:phosphoribosyl 1,2-cyclic phosphate phosphodiesterase
MDHVAGLDDLRIYSYINESALPAYASKKCIDSIRSRFDYMFGENKYPGSTSLKLIEAKEQFRLGDLNITTLPVMHGKTEVYGYRINDFSYVTDVKDIPDTTLEKIKGSKVLVLGALRWEPEHPTHQTIPQAVKVIEALEIPEAYLIHMNSYVDHEPTNKKLPDHIKLAYDQQVITI